MSGMLASVCNLEETRVVLEEGVDIIDLKDPCEGALGALKFSVIEKIVKHVNGSTPVSATIGDLPFKAKIVEPVIKRMSGIGVDIIKVGLFDALNGISELHMLSRLSQQGIRIVLVLFAETYQQGSELEELANTGITGMMLDTMDKRSGGLREKLADEVLGQFVQETGKYGLISGLAGSLTVEDIGPLLDINPHYLGFRGGLCQMRRRQKNLDVKAVRKIRQLISPSYENLADSVAIM